MCTKPGFWWYWAATLSIAARSVWVKFASAAEKSIVATVRPADFGSADAGVGSDGGGGGAAIEAIGGGGGGGWGAALAIAVGATAEAAGVGDGAMVGDGGGGGGWVTSGSGDSLIVGDCRLDSFGPG